jgi:tight adherence protein C
LTQDGGDLSWQRAGSPAEWLRFVHHTSLDARSPRFIDGLLVAIERGVPLARCYAPRRRMSGRRVEGLLEAGDRKGIAMMVPVVCLALPITVLFER